MEEADRNTQQVECHPEPCASSILDSFCLIYAERKQKGIFEVSLLFPKINASQCKVKKCAFDFNCKWQADTLEVMQLFSKYSVTMRG